MKLSGVMMNNTEKIYPVKRLGLDAMQSIKNYCHIVETENSAGIFLDSVLHYLKNPSLNGYKIDSYKNFNEANDEFLARFPELEVQTPINLDQFYFVKTLPLYSVMIFSFGAMITQDIYKQDYLLEQATKDNTLEFIQCGLSYEEAQYLVKMRLKSEKFMNFDLPIEETFLFQDIENILK